MEMKSFYPKGNWVKRKSRIKESVESLIKWVFEKTVRKSWQSRWNFLRMKQICRKRLLFGGNFSEWNDYFRPYRIPMPEIIQGAAAYPGIKSSFFSRLPM